MNERSPLPDIDQSPQIVSFDAIMPAAMAARAEESGVRRAAMDPITVFVLSILAGAFISFGAAFATTVGAGGISLSAEGGTTALSGALPYGLTRLFVGVSFSIGLFLVVIAGAELFT